VCLTLSALAALLLAQIDEYSASPSERAVLASRDAIAAGHVVLESKTFTDQEGQLKEFSRSRYAIWFDKDRLRTDRQVWRPGDNGGWGQILDERVGRMDAKIFRFNQDPNNPNRRILAQEVTPADAGWESARKQLFDIRLLGLAPVPFEVLHSVVPNRFVAATPRSQSVIREFENENGKIVSVSYRTSRGGMAQLDIALDRGPNLLKGVLSGETYRDSIECTLEQFPSKGQAQHRWFPSVVRCVQEVEGRTIRINEVQVVEAVFDEPQPESLFTWEGLGATAGTLVQRSKEAGGRLEVFNGTSLEPFRPNNPPPQASAATWGTASRGVLLRMGIGLGVLAAAVWAVWLVQRLRGGPAAQGK